MRVKRPACDDRACGGGAACVPPPAPASAAGTASPATAGGGGGCALEGCPPGMAASPGGTMEFVVLPASALLPLSDPAGELAAALGDVASDNFAVAYAAVEAVRRAARHHAALVVTHA